ncbi:uncharacterized protein LOC143174470 [Nomia melanderi]|uniref:uncharacterized protein LOC143174470 n=1 Tax=Nomia melanderi TaxID=2448451 RepID=UPI003FCDC425
MSWLFGWKKHQKGSPQESTEETKGSDRNEDYVFVDDAPASLPTHPYARNAPGYPTENLYPLVPPVSEYSSLSIDTASNQGESSRYLNDIPFKLCKQLEIIENNDFEVDRLRVGEILSFIERIENDDYSYNFSVEESVVAEMNSGNDQ